MMLPHSSIMSLIHFLFILMFILNLSFNYVCSLLTIISFHPISVVYFPMNLLYPFQLVISCFSVLSSQKYHLLPYIYYSILLFPFPFPLLSCLLFSKFAVVVIVIVIVIVVVIVGTLWILKQKSKV